MPIRGTAATETGTNGGRSLLVGRALSTRSKRLVMTQRWAWGRFYCSCCREVAGKEGYGDDGTVAEGAREDGGGGLGAAGIRGGLGEGGREVDGGGFYFDTEAQRRGGSKEQTVWMAERVWGTADAKLTVGQFY